MADLIYEKEYLSIFFPKFVLVYALHSLEYVLGLARFQVFVPNIYIYIFIHQRKDRHSYLQLYSCPSYNAMVTKKFRVTRITLYKLKNTIFFLHRTISRCKKLCYTSDTFISIVIESEEVYYLEIFFKFL